jgi:hypothetical protein
LPNSAEAEYRMGRLGKRADRARHLAVDLCLDRPHQITMRTSLRNRMRPIAVVLGRVIRRASSGGSCSQKPIRSICAENESLVERRKLLISQSASPEFVADDVANANGANPSRGKDDIGVVEEREPREAGRSIVCNHLVALGRCACLGILTRWKPTDQPTFFTSLAAFPATPALATSASRNIRRVIRTHASECPCANRYGVLPW